MANQLTALRLLLVVPVTWSIVDPLFIRPWLLLLLLVLAIASDLLDGIVARKLNTASAQGQLFDHTADFLFVTSGLAAAAYAELLHPLLPILIAVAFSQYVLDSRYLFKQKHLHLSFLGRWNGILYFVPIVLIAVSRMEFIAQLEPILLILISILGYGLILSTLASIIDRTITPIIKSNLP